MACGNPSGKLWQKSGVFKQLEAILRGGHVFKTRAKLIDRHFPRGGRNPRKEMEPVMASFLHFLFLLLSGPGSPVQIFSIGIGINYGADPNVLRAFSNSNVDFIVGVGNEIEEEQGTPMKPSVPIDIYVFALFNEDLKPGPASERKYGLYYPDGTPVYNIGLQGYLPEIASASNINDSVSKCD
ncbi:hypothetical protein HHK36_011394 [Tetracentron sinense]|uniref:Uncharacterized protein n=1 Tax=Tetracentron sinense TaxID=13715 RepID=A0A835DJU7_TETSI|nr:hypothetical protein HHK36_011394 [Tetracentron sinense]